MKKLWITLPAFAPDYSGVCSAFFELGGLSVIHDASGCTGNYTGYDEPRWYGSDARVLCSGLREIDAVLGRDEKLMDEVVYASEDLKPTMITVLGSPVPMVIGTDMQGIARELESRTGVPTFGFDTNGLFLYNRGVSDAMMALARRFAKPGNETIPGGVNILGMTPLDFSANANALALPAFLEQKGFQVLGRLMMGVTIKQIEELGKAQVNLVVTQSGIATAQYLKEQLGTPYVVGLPIGSGEAVCDLLAATIRDGQDRVLLDPAAEGGILIIAEQVLANAMRREILEQSPLARVTVGSMFGLDHTIASPGDLDIPDEYSLCQMISSGRFSSLVGDPLFEELIAEDDNLHFHPLPHVAISSKIHWDEVPIWLGTEMRELINQIIEQEC